MVFLGSLVLLMKLRKPVVSLRYEACFCAIAAEEGLILAWLRQT